MLPRLAIKVKKDPKTNILLQVIKRVRLIVLAQSLVKDHIS